MAYDYNQDAGYGGYDDGYGYGYQYGFGYDAYGYTETSPPPPDKNWEDPVKLNREYLNNIKKPIVQEGFEGLKEDGLYLLEVMVRSINLKKEVVETLVSTSESKEPLKPVTHVKLLDFPFFDLSEFDEQNNNPESKSASVITGRNSFTTLLQEVFTSPGERHDSLIPVTLDDQEHKTGTTNSKTSDQEHKTTTTISKTSGPSNEDSNEVEKPIEEVESFNVMKGKSTFIPTPGLKMIQKLQRYPLVVKVTSHFNSEEDQNDDGEHLGTSSIRLPETFRHGVLLSCMPDTLLPFVVMNTKNYPLTNFYGEDVGTVELTIILTCFGQGIANCVEETDNGYGYDNTYLLKHLKAKYSGNDYANNGVHPRIALDTLRLGLFYPREDSSSQVLRDCVAANRISFDSTEKRRAQGTSDCEWFRMLDISRPPPSVDSFDIEKLLQELEMERAALWTKHRNVCRGFEMTESPWKRDLEARFQEVKLDYDEDTDSASKKSLGGSRGGTQIETKPSKVHSEQSANGDTESVLPSLDKLSTQSSLRKSPKKTKRKTTQKQNKPTSTK